jgi:hypothetical protein
MGVDSNNPGIISKAVPFWGFLFRFLAGIPLTGRITAFTNRLLGRLLPGFSFLGFRKEASYENAVWNWEIFLKLIGADYDVDETAPQERLYTIKKCPAGHCRAEHLKGCNVTMELDNSLVERSGARLIVDKRAPLDGICIERVVPK